MPDFVKLCKEEGIKPIGGIEIRNGNEYLYTGIAKNNGGFQELNEFVTYFNLSKKKFPFHPDSFENVYIIFPFGSRSLKDLKEN